MLASSDMDDFGTPLDNMTDDFDYATKDIKHYYATTDTKRCSDTGEPNQTQTCYGHNPYDVTFFKSTHQLADGTYMQTHLTNWEVRQNQMVKGNYGLPYLYNHYEWGHCEAAYNMTFKAVEDAEYVGWVGAANDTMAVRASTPPHYPTDRTTLPTAPPMLTP